MEEKAEQLFSEELITEEKKMKKVIIWGAVACMGVSLLAGCQQKDTGTVAETTVETAAETKTVAETKAEKETAAEAAEASKLFTMRVATWNVDSKAHPDIQKMSDILLENKVEIAGFQEIDVSNTRNDYDMASAFINDSYPYMHFAKGRDFANGYFGVGVTSSLELLEKNSIPIESTGSKATKVLQRVMIEKEGKQIAFYVTHTSWENLDLRRRQLSEIIDRINADPTEYKIVVADFNTDQNHYEFSMFLDNFNIANGKDGKWIDTFTGEDDSMKVFSVDNIIATKNIRITNVGSVHSDMADHDMLYADLEFLNQSEGPENTGNRALGQEVTTSSTGGDTNAYDMVDYSMDTAWQSDENDNQEIVVELDRVYQGKRAVLNWGAERAEAYTVATSVNGTDYTETMKEDNGSGEKDEIALQGEIKFVKLTLTKKADEGKGYQMREFQVFADPVKLTASDTNILKDGDMETQDAWEFKNASEEGKAVYEFTFDGDAHDGGSSAKLMKEGEDDGDGQVMQSIALEPNKRYQLSFWHKSDSLDSGAFAYEINQRDQDGNSIPTHLAKLTDNLNMSREYRQFTYNFISSPHTVGADIVFHVLKGEGSLWLDDVCVREVVPTEEVLLSADKKELKVGETAIVKANVLPADADDIQFGWQTSDPAVATVDKDGNVTAVGQGKVYVGLVSDSDLLAESWILLEVK